MVRKNRLMVFKKYDDGGTIGPSQYTTGKLPSAYDPQTPGMIGPSDYDYSRPRRKPIFDLFKTGPDAISADATVNPGKLTSTFTPSAGRRANVFEQAKMVAGNGSLDSIVPYISNIANSFKKVPAPLKPDLLSSITGTRVNYSAESAEADRQARGANRTAELNMDENSAGAVHAANLAQTIRAKNSINENENNTNAQLKMETDRANAGIAAQNAAINNQYKEQQIEAQIAQQRNDSANLANAADKYIGQQNVKSARQLDMDRWEIYSQLFKNSGVPERVIKGVKTKDENIPDVQAYGGRMRVFAGGGDLKDKSRARKVDAPPEGYTPAGEENGRKYYNKVQPPASLAPATGGRGNDSHYEQFLQQQLQAGISPNELAAKKYISNEEIGKYQPFYKAPAEDIVYTEQQAPTASVAAPKLIDNPAQAFSGQPIYGPDKHLAGFMRYSTRNSQGQADAGMLKTAPQDAEFMYVGADGKPDSTRGMYRVPGTEWSNKFTGGTNTLHSQTGIEKYRLAMGGKLKRKPVY